MHQNQFIHFQNIVFSSLVTDNTNGRTDGRTDGRPDNIVLPPATLTWRSFENPLKLVRGRLQLFQSMPRYASACILMRINGVIVGVFSRRQYRRTIRSPTYFRRPTRQRTSTSLTRPRNRPMTPPMTHISPEPPQPITHSYSAPRPTTLAMTSPLSPRMTRGAIQVSKHKGGSRAGFLLGMLIFLNI